MWIPANPYILAANRLDVSPLIKSFISGEVEVPKYTYNGNIEGLQFPPELIPIWSEDHWPGLVAIKSNWFRGQVDSVFVKYYFEGNVLVEIARNPEQLACYLLYEFFSNVPDSGEVGDFAVASGVCGRKEVALFFAAVHSVDELNRLDVFSKDPPRESTSERSARLVTKSDVDKAIVGERWDDLWNLVNAPELSSQIVTIGLDALVHVSSAPCFIDIVKAWRNVNLSAAERYALGY